MSSGRFIRTIPESSEAVRALKRHGTTTLFAVFNVLDGTVIGRNMQRHRHQRVHPLSQHDRGAGPGGESGVLKYRIEKARAAVIKPAVSECIL
jgi:hypothetical protein